MSPEPRPLRANSPEAQARHLDPRSPDHEDGYAQAIRAGGYPPTIKEQTRQSLLSCQAILRAAGAEVTDAVTVHTLLRQSEDARALSEAFAEFLSRVRDGSR